MAPRVKLLVWVWLILIDLTFEDVGSAAKLSYWSSTTQRSRTYYVQRAIARRPAGRAAGSAQTDRETAAGSCVGPAVHGYGSSSDPPCSLRGCSSQSWEPSSASNRRGGGLPVSDRRPAPARCQRWSAAMTTSTASVPGCRLRTARAPMIARGMRDTRLNPLPPLRGLVPARHRVVACLMFGASVRFTRLSGSASAARRRSNRQRPPLVSVAMTRGRSRGASGRRGLLFCLPKQRRRSPLFHECYSS
jgi:hypothetical protein